MGEVAIKSKCLVPICTHTMKYLYVFYILGEKALLNPYMINDTILIGKRPLTNQWLYNISFISHHQYREISNVAHKTTKGKEKF